MRFIFQALIFMILFNGMLIFFSPYFNDVNYGAIDVSDSSRFTRYGNWNIENVLYDFFIGFGGTFFITALIGFIFSGNLPIAQLMGASLIVSIFIGLWNTLTSPIENIINSFAPDVFPFYTLFCIVFGVIIMFSIIEIFTGKGDESA